MTLWLRPQSDDAIPSNRTVFRPAAPGVSSMTCSILTLMVILLAAALQLHAQPADNLERLRGCAVSVADSVLAPFAEGDTVCLDIAGHPAAWLVEQSVLGRAMERNIGVVPCPSERGVRIGLAVTAIGIDYGPTDDADLLARYCRLDVGASLPIAGAANSRMVHTFSVIAGDTVEVDQTSSIEASGYDFARGTIPRQAGGGFWKKIIEPAVVLGASAVIAILLFTVRSQ